MEVHLNLGLEKRLNDLAAKTGRPADELVEVALAAYLEELAGVRGTLDSRYDDLKTGRIKPIDGEEAFARLRERSEIGSGEETLRPEYDFSKGVRGKHSGR